MEGQNGPRDRQWYSTSAPPTTQMTMITPTLASAMSQTHNIILVKILIAVEGGGDGVAAGTGTSTAIKKGYDLIARIFHK